MLKIFKFWTVICQMLSVKGFTNPKARKYLHTTGICWDVPCNYKDRDQTETLSEGYAIYYGKWRKNLFMYYFYFAFFSLILKIIWKLRTKNIFFQLYLAEFYKLTFLRVGRKCCVKKSLTFFPSNLFTNTGGVGI